LVNQRRIVRNEPPHSPEFNARTWTSACVRARGLLNMRTTGEGVAGRRGFSDFPLRLPGRSATARDRRDGDYVFVNSNSISIRAGDPRAFVSTRFESKGAESRGTSAQVSRELIGNRRSDVRCRVADGGRPGQSTRCDNRCCGTLSGHRVDVGAIDSPPVAEAKTSTATT